jgi:type II secretory pathway pseudopilin PulG
VSRYHFTTWQSLIILVLLAALIAIALPNFLERDNRPARASHAKSGMRDLATAIEAYRIEHGVYPPWVPATDPVAINAGVEMVGDLPSFRSIGGSLTTPTAFIDAYPRDWFTRNRASYVYYSDQGGWILVSPCWDRDYDIDPRRDYDSQISQPTETLLQRAYDPTNGTRSGGDIFRISGHRAIWQ